MYIQSGVRAHGAVEPVVFPTDIGVNCHAVVDVDLEGFRLVVSTLPCSVEYAHETPL